MRKTHFRLAALVAILSVVALLGPPARAEVSGGTSISVTSTSQTVTFTSLRGAVTVINDASSANEIYFRLFTAADTPAAATTAGVRLQPGESLSFAFSGFSELGGGYLAVSLVCDTAETATARVVSK
jgi:hypothetical protein